MNKKLLAQILIPALIVLSIGAIWIYKNTETLEPKVTESSADGKESGPVNNDFILETDEVNIETLSAYGLPIIFDFGSESCDPCRRMKPDLIAVNAAMQGKAIIKYIDVWEHTDEATGYPITLIPTQMFINADGTPYVPSYDLGIDFMMYNRKDTGEHALTMHEGMLTEEQMLLILEDMGV
ncbi:MAG: thioredoxin family protein [Clostridiaceae bacterium]|nr:thioredoxin family protein [Clostridiaceae bacterium]